MPNLGGIARALCVAGLMTLGFGPGCSDAGGSPEQEGETAAQAFEVTTTSAGPFQQDSGTNGIVSIEAEHFHANTSQGSHQWTQVSPAGVSGGFAMQATPNNGANNMTGYVSTSPRLDFQINFVKTGTHYIWARGIGATTGDDSYNAGIDGQAPATADRIGNFPATLGWRKLDMDGLAASVNVTSTGQHTINVWMREDGFVIDKILLTTSASYTPTGSGPAESPQAGGNQPPTVSITSPSPGTPFAAPVAIKVQVSASDADGTVNRVELYQDGKLVGVDRSFPYEWLLTNVPEGSHVLKATAFDAAGASTSSQMNVTMGPAPAGGTGAFQQDPGANGIVSMEAESFFSNTPQGGHQWVKTSPTGSSGGFAMQATPNDGTNNMTGYVSTSPRLDFQIDFVKTGTHYLWARGIGPTTGDDSYNAGIDGQAPATADRIGNFPTTLGWRKLDMDGGAASINVPSTGRHTVNVWMREDGFIIDKLLLTTSSSYVPSGTGPAESPRTAGTTDIDVTFVDRLPHYDYDDPVQQLPNKGEQVSWIGHVKFQGSAPATVNYAWLLDGQVVLQGPVTLTPGKEAQIAYDRTWDGERHELMLRLDPENALVEESEQNNVVFDFTDALVVGLEPERSFVDAFPALQRQLGIGSVSFEDWAQRVGRVWNLILMEKAQSFNHTNSIDIKDRVRVVLSYHENNTLGPANEFTPWKAVDMLWGMPTYALPDVIADSKRWFYEGALVHELSHARYLIDNYTFNVHNSIVNVLDNGVRVVDTAYLPKFGWDDVYSTPHYGMMVGNYSSVYDLYSGYLLNRIAGKRSPWGNTNYASRDAFTNTDLPNAVGLVIRNMNDAPWVNAKVEIYRRSGHVFGTNEYDNTVDATLFTDASGRVTFPLDFLQVIGWDWGQAHSPLLVRITAPDGSAREYRFVESADFQIGYWEGSSSRFDYSIRTNFDPVPYVDSVQFPAGGLPAGQSSEVTFNGHDFKPGFTARFYSDRLTINSLTYVSSTQVKVNVFVPSDVTTGFAYQLYNPDGKEFRIHDPYQIGLNVQLSDKPQARFTSFDLSKTQPRTVYLNGLWSHDWGRHFQFNDIVGGQPPAGVGSIASYSWNFGDGSPASTAAFVAHTYAAPGQYRVTLTVTDANGNTGAHTEAVTVQ
jgi:Gylcosyl hydrolase family 115 C-terminal domain/PKD domain/Bacterial Ig domain